MPHDTDAAELVAKLLCEAWQRCQAVLHKRPQGRATRCQQTSITSAASMLHALHVAGGEGADDPRAHRVDHVGKLG